MGERYQKAFTGKPFSFPAALYNDLLDLVKWWKLQSGHAGAGTPAPSSRNQNTIMVRNDSGADADERFSVLGIDDIVFTPTDNERGFQNEPLLSVVTPTVADHLGKFVITQQPLKNGKLCRAVATGLTPVKIDVVHEDDEWADVKDGDTTQLQSGASGSARIVYKEPGTGTKWAIVLLGSSPPPVILAKITGHKDANDYTAKSIRGAAPNTATFADTDFGDELAEEDDIIARDRAQIGGSTPRPLTGLVIAGKVIGRTDDGKRIVEFYSQKAGTLFFVSLTSDGGSIGTKTTASSWTYTATDVHGNELGTSLEPEKPRINGTFAAATKGYGYFDETGAFRLAEAWETPGTGGCE